MPACTAMILLRTITRRIDLAKGHAQQVEDADAGPRGHALDPEAEVAGEDREEDQAADQQGEQRHDPHDVANFRLAKYRP